MFYGAYVLAKKGPLAKVWLAAHWDKKLTKAHVFETDVSATVEDIISPKVRMALRTSGHLLLGVVRIYSRKQKYLIHDLGEACAKIRMAFRPGIVDLPSEGGVVNTDAITLPEIFHDFETAVADLGSLDMEEQFTINRSRVAEITIAEDTTGGGVGANDPFSEFGEFGDEFGGGMEDIEKARKAVTFEEEKDRTDRDSLQVTGDGSTTLLPGRREGGDAMEEEQLPDRNDFGGGDFLEDLGGLGGLEGLGEVPSVGDITMEGAPRDEDKTADGEEAMEVDRQREGEEGADITSEQQGGTVQPPAAEGGEEEGFILEPVDVTLAAADTASSRAKKRKRRLVVDEDKEFSSKSIRKQLENYSDILQQKLFPPPTKRAMLWKDMTTCEQLFVRPVFPLVSREIFRLVTRNYTNQIPCDAAAAAGEESVVDLEQQEGDGNATRDTTTVEKARAGETGSIILSGGEAADQTILDGIDGDTTSTVLPAVEEDPREFEDGARPFDQEEGGEFPPDGAPADQQETSRVIPDMPELEGLSSEDAQTAAPGGDQQSGEMSEEFEKRRWTKRTQQVLRMLDRNFAGNSQTPFSTLTQKCNRKQAASRFYTCLLLAKENTIHVQQDRAYGEILITKGPKFARAF